MSPPQSVRETRRLLGMAGFYRSYVPKFAEIVKPLTELTKKYTRFKWTSVEQAAFNRLKELLVSSHVMALPDTSKPYIL